ncbi:MAG: dihydrolipoamide acetyltransferase family protein [Myxococcota bacterium]
MATPVQMPALSPTMKEGKITRWLKKEGEKVSSGEAIAEVETDKANLEVESYEDGFLVKVVVGEGASAPVGEPIAFIGAKGEKVEGKPETKPVKKEVFEAAPAGARLRASPLAKKMAREGGLELSRVSGTGPAGRIIKRDVEQALAVGPPAARPPAWVARAFERVEPEALPLSSMRKVIAERMTQAKREVPHFYLAVEVEMDAAMKIREEAKALDTKVSLNDVVVKAAAMAVRRFPRINVQFQGDRVLKLRNIDVGVAVALDEGLLTPVIRDADQKGLAQISAEMRDYAERARARKLRPEEYTGGSITVSNLGMFGVDSFVAVINPPQPAILAVGAVTPRVVVREGQMVVRQMMSITFSGDHRVIDGALGAQYVRELQSLLEHPMRLLL